MTFKKKLLTRKKKMSKLVLVHDIKSGHDILMPLNTINNNPSRFKLITKEEQAQKDYKKTCIQIICMLIFTKNKFYFLNSG